MFYFNRIKYFNRIRYFVAIGNDDDDDDSVYPYLFTWNELLNVEFKNFKLQGNYSPIHEIIFVIFLIYVSV